MTEPTRAALDPHARRAVAGDLDELIRLAGEALEHVGSHRGGPVFRDRDSRPHPVDETVASDLDAMAAGQAVVLMGCIGGTAVGYAVARVEPTRGSPVVAIADIYVEPDARGVGVGASLMEELLSFADSTGCAGIEAVALPGDRATKNFFEAFGLVARKITVHRPLSPPSSDAPDVDG